MSPSAVPSARTICQSALAPGEKRAVEFRPGKRPAGQGDDTPSPLRHVPYIERLAQGRLQTEDLRQARFGKPLAHHALLMGPFTLGSSPARSDTERAA